jgi:farnesyl diphosphate synthase
MRTGLAEWTADVLARVEHALERSLPAATQAPQRLHAAMRYAVLGGGKRVRPLLAFAAGEACGAPPERLETVACALELVHAYSLVHDDLPCMDDDVLRRGKPTVHVEFDEATALLVGDSLQSLAFELLASCRLSDDADAQRLMTHTLAQAIGSRGMAGGQAMDLAATGNTLTPPELEMMHIYKTGALIRAAVSLGARCGSVSPASFEQLDRYAKCVGLAFQVVDDVLDAEQSTATLGKTAGKDAAQGKPTYISVLGLEEAQALSRRLREEAHEALAGFDERAQHLHELADFIVYRKF